MVTACISRTFPSKNFFYAYCMPLRHSSFLIGGAGPLAGALQRMIVASRWLPGHYASILGTMTVPVAIQVRKRTCCRRSRSYVCGEFAVCLGVPFVSLTHGWWSSHADWWQFALAGAIRVSRVRYCQPFGDWKLGFRQYSFHHAHLTLCSPPGCAARFRDVSRHALVPFPFRSLSRFRHR
jgi:hypothetical protein